MKEFKKNFILSIIINLFLWIPLIIISENDFSIFDIDINIDLYLVSTYLITVFGYIIITSIVLKKYELSKIKYHIFNAVLSLGMNVFIAIIINILNNIRLTYTCTGEWYCLLDGVAYFLFPIIYLTIPVAILIIMLPYTLVKNSIKKNK